MIDTQTRDLEEVFHALASDTRRKILTQLANRELTVQSLADRNDISKQAVSKQLKILSKSGLIKERRSGREKYCRFDPEPLGSLRRYLDELENFWDEKLNNLKNHIEGEL
ncbi:MAG: metalloregulator ArsR/SmtB family transcription factor [Deltaproteobacteria bacterium]